MLDKPLFDCNDIGDFYDCGCEEGETLEADEAGARTESQKDQRTGHEGNTSPPVEISKEPSVLSWLDPSTT